jgi:hypothetical protein
LEANQRTIGESSEFTIRPMQTKALPSAVDQQGKRSGDPLEVAMQRAVDRIRGMSQKERVQSLIDAGILTAKGKLAAAYR